LTQDFSGFTTVRESKTTTTKTTTRYSSKIVEKKRTASRSYLNTDKKRAKANPQKGKRKNEDGDELSWSDMVILSCVEMEMIDSDTDSESWRR